MVSYEKRDAIRASGSELATSSSSPSSSSQTSGWMTNHGSGEHHPTRDIDHQPNRIRSSQQMCRLFTGKSGILDAEVDVGGSALFYHQALRDGLLTPAWCQTLESARSHDHSTATGAMSSRSIERAKRKRDSSFPRRAQALRPETRSRTNGEIAAKTRKKRGFGLAAVSESAVAVCGLSPVSR